jgi:hypothetical protein
VWGWDRMDWFECFDCLDDDTDFQLAQKVLYDLWYEYAERLLERVIEVCDLTEDQASALRQTYLRPNSFVVEVV